MEVALSYDHRTAVTSSLEGSTMDFATNLQRAPVSFRGRVKEPLLMRQLMGALHEVILNDSRWLSDEDYALTLDPVITVHPDQLFFEAFSNDESSYARLSAPLDAFEPEGVVNYGTTNIDFTWQLRAALSELRSSRRTLFGVGAGGFGVTTVGTAKGTKVHFERKVDLPESWLKGFLQVQGALAMRPFTFDVRPVDLLSMIAFFEENKPPRHGAHAVRYEFRPGEPISIVLEPWEKRFTLKGTHYEGYERAVRLWGRRRLSLLRNVLPYAERVTLGVLGRGLPHFYICHCGGYQFTLLLSGWSRNDWATGSAFDLMASNETISPATVARVYRFLSEHLIASRSQMAEEIALEKAEIEHALFQLCRSGRVTWDPTIRCYRLRELFAEPIDMDALFTPDPRVEHAQQLADQGNVTITHILPPAENPRGETKVEAEVIPNTSTPYKVIVAMDDDQRIRFGQCECPFFQEHIMGRGPCEHILAVRFALQKK
ncbi:MAG: SWIM zinc finger family protein [Ardenticatenales bacterium]|nr:SWIM zinc finger family protein [Ardenticatenales bacterium]